LDGPYDSCRIEIHQLIAQLSAMTEQLTGAEKDRAAVECDAAIAQTALASAGQFLRMQEEHLPRWRAMALLPVGRGSDRNSSLARKSRLDCHYFGILINEPKVKRVRQIGHRRCMACAR
jgi:hypothetical protein